MHVLAFFFCLLALAASSGIARAQSPDSPRQIISLNGTWQFQREGSDGWKDVRVPSTFQDHEGTNFHGVGWYQRTVAPISLASGKRVLLHFRAAATEAEVFWDGQRLGSHLGGWTPFRFDITEHLRKAASGQPHELRVRLDEKVGHNTQGFLPVIEPHFGGLWQEVSLLIVPESYIDDLQVLATGDPKTSEMRLEVPLSGTIPASLTQVSVHYRLRGTEQWKELHGSPTPSTKTLLIHGTIADARPWSPAEPNMYEVELTLQGAGGDRVHTRAAFRSLEAFGPGFRLNGQPLSIRGLLNWGYSPPHFAPNPGEVAWREELHFARSRGFNLMKFCLWVPPQRYLELADEEGMLTWMEYPTWHPTFTGKFLEPLRREFREFFLYDRNHPSVILRSLTCETGPSAELAVIRSLFEQAHELIPGALVEDDSSWISWNRVNDFYDDHPYGNNHNWVKTLEGFKEYILAHGLKPLILGEAIAADTWLDREAILARLRSERPWWGPAPLDDTGRWLDQMRKIGGNSGLNDLRADSLHYGLLMRKYQIEAFRRELPFGGYVISVIRDFPKASMGLLDYLGRPKWSESDWAWQRDTLCLLKTPDDRRSFEGGEGLHAQILLSHFGREAIHEGQLKITLEQPGNPATPLHSQTETNIEQNPGSLAELIEVNWSLPAVTEPKQLFLRANCKSSIGQFTNEWPLWVVPAITGSHSNRVRIHASVSRELRHDLFDGCSTLDSAALSAFDPRLTVVASHFDDELVRWLELGGKVLFLPDGNSPSFALSSHWFLRGGPYIPTNSLSQRIPRDFFVELQHFDLAADVVPNLPQLESFDPILMLWDTHDLDVVKTHGIIFETRAAKGRLLVSAARHTSSNAAGRWLLDALLNHLDSDDMPRHALPDDVWGYLKARLHADQTNLVSRLWQFKPDPKGEGLTQGWHSTALASDADWKPIHIGTWWELQGYPELDGWAWYRLWVDIPGSWTTRDVYLSFEGVDDMYELYINSELAGKGGDLATRKDALNEKKSHNITRLVKPGSRALITVRVYDWYGYGGIFRPVTLGTLPFNPELDLLK
jgi:hypothetical protein